MNHIVGTHMQGARGEERDNYSPFIRLCLLTTTQQKYTMSI